MANYVYDKEKNELVKTAGNAVNNIDDANVSEKTTWSSEKINSELGELSFKQTTGSIIGTGTYVSHKEYENSMMKCFEVTVVNNTGADVQPGSDIQIGQMVGVDTTKQIYITQTSYSGNSVIVPAISSEGKLTARILASAWSNMYDCKFRIIVFKN